MDHIYGYANFQMFVVSLGLSVFAPTFKPWKTYTHHKYSPNQGFHVQLLLSQKQHLVVLYVPWNNIHHILHNNFSFLFYKYYMQYIFGNLPNLMNAYE